MKKALFLLLLITSLIEAQQVKPADTLPVELIYFEAESFPDSVQLRWGTATELMNYGFEIQRASDQAVWDVLGFVPGHGTSYTVHHYTFADTTAVGDNLYYYRMRQIDNDGQFKFTDTLTLNYVTSIIQTSSQLPENFAVSQNFPNPFNPATSIKVNLAEYSQLRADVYDINGTLLYSSDYGRLFPGTYIINIEGGGWSSGIYFYKITAENKALVKAMVLLK